MDITYVGKVPGTYYRLAADRQAKFGHKPIIGAWRQQNASRYIREFQSRRSLLVWKILGQRTDGWTNDDFPTETVPGDPTTLTHKGQPVKERNQESLADLDYIGTAMPPPEAVAGTYSGPDGKKIKVAPLSEEDRLTLIRWIDLGCPIDLDHGQPKSYGWMADDNRPVLTLRVTSEKMLVGMYDYGSGLDLGTFNVTVAGADWSPRFKASSPGVWELPLAVPLGKALVDVSVKDRAGNLSRMLRALTP